MEKEKKEYTYYKKTVVYTVGVRMFRNDPLGAALDNANPVVQVDKEKIRDFKLANKEAIMSGLIIEVEEPTIEWETENALTDTEITDLNKSYLALKAKLPKIDSLSLLYRILEDAKAHDRTKKTLQLTEARIEDLEVEDNFSIRPEDMQGVK